MQENEAENTQQQEHIEIKDIERFVRYLVAELNYSANTAKAYSVDMYEFAEFVKNTKNIDLANCDKNIIRDYLANLYNKNLKKSSIIRKLAVLKSFYKFLVITDVIKANPTISMATPKKDKRIPVFLTEQEILNLFDMSDIDLRDKAMLELLYSSGIRIEEMININEKDIDFISGYVKVFGKGAKERFAPVGDRCLSAIRKYMNAEREKGFSFMPNSPVFINKNGKRLTQRGARKMLHNWFVKAGLKKKVSPHTIRHTFATHLLDRGCDIRSVQQMLGHKNLSTTQIYTHVTLETLRKVYDAAHPRS
ncbi:MAG: tyrosine recombinase XerC [Elusimicrobia bacterium]|nr:tyrosine recombinase XerC [Elusimicrobiota bacterium]